MFVVMELQQQQNALHPLVSVHTSLAEAESKYHTVLAYAAVSAIPVHAAALLGSAGNVIKSECYRHDQAQGQGGAGE